MWYRLVCLVVTGASLSACGTKESVSLSALVEGATLELRGGALGTELSGACTLVFTLGDYSGGATTATFEGLSVVGEGVEIGPLRLTPPLERFDLVPGGSVRFPVTLAHPALLTATEVTALCARPPSLRGAVTDTLSGERSTPLSSGPVPVTGCP